MSEESKAAEPVIGYVRITVPVNMTKMVRARNANGCLSQKQLAASLGVTASTVCSAENGSRPIDGKVFERWLRRLDVRLADVEVKADEA